MHHVAVLGLQLGDFLNISLEFGFSLLLVFFVVVVVFFGLFKFKEINHQIIVATKLHVATSRMSTGTLGNITYGLRNSWY